MVPRYSSLFVGFSKEEFVSEVLPLMYDGVKVFWFADESDSAYLGREYREFCQARLLHLYVCHMKEHFRIDDGILDGSGSLFERLCAEVQGFNAGQYVVEHFSGKNLIVRASAGTGKTAVMIDRILYLLHAMDVKPSEIVMVTFTNKATEEMGRRIQAALEGRYRVTGHVRYLRMMEQLSDMTICTIDSLSANLLRIHGYNVGYSGKVSIRSYKQEKRELVYGLLDTYYNGSGRVKSKLGLDLHEVSKTILEFIERVGMSGVPVSNLMRMDWGLAAPGDATKIQDVLRYVMGNIDAEYDRVRLDHDAVSISDLTHDVNRSVSVSQSSSTDVIPRYLFIDEFQDTNYEQIRLVSDIISRWDITTFVVGDPKQSIYRFRGADDSAFDTLKGMLVENGLDNPVEFELVNNYRTDPSILSRLDRLFRKWVDDGFLSDFKRLVPCAPGMGGDLHVRNMNPWTGDVLVRDISESVRDLSQRIQDGTASPDAKVAVLVRSNFQMDKVAERCEGRVPIIARRDRPFFLSDAVRDFMSMLRSYVYPNEPSAMFDYLMSPYVSISEPLVLEELSSLNGDRLLLSDLMLYYTEDSGREYYTRRFRENPAMSVIWEMLEDIPVVDNYVARLKAEGVTDIRLLGDKARIYRANLDKLLTVLYRQTSGDSLSLYRMMDFLEVSIATNRDEKEVETDVDTLAVCMTVHAAKGLEFDTVIVPSTSFPQPKECSEILVSKNRDKVGWRYYKDAGTNAVSYENGYYHNIRDEEYERYLCEETRILYVALTRSKHRLVVYATPKEGQYQPANRILEGI